MSRSGKTHEGRNTENHKRIRGFARTARKPGGKRDGVRGIGAQEKGIRRFLHQRGARHRKRDGRKAPRSRAENSRGHRAAPPRFHRKARDRGAGIHKFFRQRNPVRIAASGNYPSRRKVRSLQRGFRTEGHSRIRKRQSHGIPSFRPREKRRCRRLGVQNTFLPRVRGDQGILHK